MGDQTPGSPRQRPVGERLFVITKSWCFAAQINNTTHILDYFLPVKPQQSLQFGSHGAGLAGYTTRPSGRCTWGFPDDVPGRAARAQGVVPSCEEECPLLCCQQLPGGQTACIIATTATPSISCRATGARQDGRCVLQAALDLSTSTKPFDSVTAAHLLNLLLHQPDLSQALLHCAQQQGLDFQLPSPPTMASDMLILELNTLAVVQFLLCCLQSEVSRAESPLLQAAASYPLHGRAHCITAVLQHLNTESLTQTEQWRSLVSELIAVCYRMSDVVSPVVQSSSPEGLIPMDTDS
ncbi:thyroid adenoma-associated protein homolog, partial [Lates japonicus]